MDFHDVLAIHVLVMYQLLGGFTGSQQMGVLKGEGALSISHEEGGSHLARVIKEGGSHLA